LLSGYTQVDFTVLVSFAHFQTLVALNSALANERSDYWADGLGLGLELGLVVNY